MLQRIATAVMKMRLVPKSHIVTKFSGASLEQFSDCSQQLLENSPTYDNSALCAKLEHGALAPELYARTGHDAVYRVLQSLQDSRMGCLPPCLGQGN